MIRIGAHVSINGGIATTLAKLHEIGGNSLQIFSSPPQRWESSQLTQSQAQEWSVALQKEQVFPIFIHGCYLINLASDNTELILKSKQSLIADLQFCNKIGGSGVIFHFGSNPSGWLGKRLSLIPVLQEILAKTPTDTHLIIENAAGNGSKIGNTFMELGTILRDMSHPRLKICIDTAHALSSGYEFRTPVAAHEFAKQVGDTIGWDHVAAIHLNDSKVDLGKRRDLHENIGEGFIGMAGFSALFSETLRYSIPMILETPGLDNQGPDKTNIDRVKLLVDGYV